MRFSIPSASVELLTSGTLRIFLTNALAITSERPNRANKMFKASSKLSSTICRCWTSCAALPFRLLRNRANF